MSRTFHISRLLDFINGSIINGSRTNVQKLAGMRKLDAKIIEKTFRDLVTSTLPVIYIIDLALIEEEVLRYLSTSTKDIKIILDKEDQAGLNTRVATGISNIKRGELTNILLTALSTKLSKTSFLELTSVMEDIFNITKEGFQLAEINNKSYQTYRVIASKAGAEVRRYLNSIKVSILNNAGKAIQYNPTTQVIIIGATFNVAKDIANEIIQKETVDYIQNTLDITFKAWTKEIPGFQVGSIVNAGHTSATSSGKLIGINMPSALEDMYRSTSVQTSTSIEAAVGNIDIHIDHSIKFNEEYSAVAGILLDLNFSFIVSQASNLNTSTLNTKERAARKSVIDRAILSSLQDVTKKRLTGGILTEVTLGLKNSPTIPEFIQGLTVATLSGEPLKKVSKTGSINGKTEKLKIPVINFSNAALKISKNLAKSKKLKLPNTRMRTPTGQFLSPVSIKNLLNSKLAQEIQRNMGKGNARNILNYRTGRFANSAEVTNVTNRDGAITAFYSYMKNPYATFAPGGRQAHPESRDPNKLIATSIRQLAATIMQNRLKVVPV